MTEYAIVPKFGYGKMRTWFEARYNAEKGCMEYVGMGQTIFYDRDGRVEDIKQSETGLVMVYEGVGGRRCTIYSQARSIIRKAVQTIMWRRRRR